MKVGVRKPSLKRSFKARTTGRFKRSIKRSINPLYGKKGMGWIRNPKKALYNKVYHKTTISAKDLVGTVAATGIAAAATTKKRSPKKRSFEEWPWAVIFGGVFIFFAFGLIETEPVIAFILFGIGAFLCLKKKRPAVKNDMRENEENEDQGTQE